MPTIEPACFMNCGQSKPSSNESVVPETAPIAKSRSMTRAQVRAIS